MKNNKYIRQTRLTEVGEAGQEKLLNTNVLIVGCGGLGGEVAVHLAASGIGSIALADFDVVSVSNLHRQVFFKEKDIGKTKTEVLKKYIALQNSDVKLQTFNNALVKSNVRTIIQAFDLIVDCTDSLETKFLLNDACVLENKTLVYGSLHKYEGQVAVFNALDKEGKRSANLRDAFPEIPQENIPSCSEVGTLNAVVSMIASLQTNEVLKYVLGIGKVLKNTLLIYNILENNQFKLTLKVNCNLNYISIWNTNTYLAEKCTTLSLKEIDKTSFKERVQQGNMKVISLLEDDLNLDFKVDFHVAFSEIEQGNYALENNDYIVICKRGKTSLKAVKLLQEQYPRSHFLSLVGGVQNLYHKET